MLRALIFRLRQLIKTFIPEGEDEALYMKVSFNHGYYSLEIGENVIIDSDEFESLIALGDKSSSEDINSSIDYYEKALDFYQGMYLEENAYEIWLVPIKNYYNRLYIKSLFNLLEMLKEKKEYKKIIKICRDAITIEPKNEDIHIFLMETMLELGQGRDALDHYKYISFVLDKDKSINSSSPLNDVYRKIQDYLTEKSGMNLIDIKQKLEEDDESGPLQCGFDYFKFLYNTEKRKRSAEEMDFIVLITLEEDLKQEDLKQWAKIMLEVLKDSLRKGDVFTFWNESQILILLHNIKGNGLKVVEDRIKENLNKNSIDAKYEVKIESSLIVLEKETVSI